MDLDDRTKRICIVVSIVLILVLCWYRRRPCTARCCKKMPPLEEKKSGLDPSGGRGKPKLNPEFDIMSQHTAGDRLKYTDSGLTDPLSLDPFAKLKSTETADDRLHRNLITAGVDGLQMDGMQPPVEEFERNSMIRQLQKTQDVYGDQTYAADELSELNI